MFRMFGFYLALVSIFMIQSLNAQVKIGEIREGVAVITHDMDDLLRACEKEYDENVNTTFNKAEIKIFNKDTYWLFAGNSKNKDEFQFSIMLAKSSVNNDLFIKHIDDENSKTQKPNEGNIPRKGVKIERYLKIGK